MTERPSILSVLKFISAHHPFIELNGDEITLRAPEETMTVPREVMTVVARERWIEECAGPGSGFWMLSYLGHLALDGMSEKAN